MMSTSKKFIFIHVPKTGGNSIQNILRNYSEDSIVKLNDMQDGIERFQVRHAKYDLRKHSTLSDYKSVLNSDMYRCLFKFSTIRNPWERMISFYFSPHRKVTEWRREKFLNFINKVKTLRHFISDEQSNINQGLINDIDFLIRFEDLNNDFKKVCEILKIPYTPLQKRNRSKHMHYSRYYDDELKEIVRIKFQEEIEFGNYSFEDET